MRKMGDEQAAPTATTQGGLATKAQTRSFFSQSQ